MCLSVLSFSPLEPPSAPSNLQAVDTTPSSITLQWEPPVNTGLVHINGYMVEMCPQGETEFTLVGMVAGTQTEYEAIGLKPNQGYHFRVRARNIAGFSDEAVENKEAFIAKLPYGSVIVLFLIFANHRYLLFQTMHVPQQKKEMEKCLHGSV